jgi:teichuronic acid exporter
MSAPQSIRSGSAWIFSGNASLQVVQFIVGVVLARLLSPADFGALVTIQIFTGIAGFLASGGMGQALVRARNADASHFQVVFTIQLLSGCVIYCVFWGLAPMLATAYQNPVYRDLVRVSALGFIIRPFVNVPNSWLQREMRFRRRTALQLLSVPIGSAASIILAARGHGPWSLVLGGLVSSVTLAILGIATYPRFVRLRLEMTIARELGTYSAKLTLNDILSYMRNQTANFLIGALAGATSVGLYNKADSLAKLPQTISGAVYDPVFRGLSKLSGDPCQSRQIYYRAITLLAVYMLPIYFGLMWLAEPFILLVYGEKWLLAAMPLKILCAGGVFACVGHPAGAVLAANNWLGRELVVQVAATALVAAACIGGLRWGLEGVAFGLLIAWGYSTLHLLVLCNRCIGARLTEVTRSLGPALGLAAAMNVALFVVDRLFASALDGTRSAFYLFAMTFAGFIVYAGCFLMVPIPPIASEAARWRAAMIRIVRAKDKPIA